MLNKMFLAALLAIAFAGCQNSNKQKASAATDSHDAHEKVKFQYTAYISDFEVFAEADAFVVGETANVLSHFSRLPDFKALVIGSMTIHLLVNCKEVSQTLDKPTEKAFTVSIFNPK